MVIRKLEKKDKFQIISLLDTRSKLGSASKRDTPESVASYIVSRINDPKFFAYGIFDGEILDALNLAEDISEYRKTQSIYWGLIATRKKTNRVKTAAGWDKNITDLTNYMHELIIGNTPSEHWLSRPETFNGYSTNLDINFWKENRAKFQYTETIKAGEMSTGSEAEFIKSHIFKAPRLDENWIVSCVIVTPRQKK